MRCLLIIILSLVLAGCGDREQEAEQKAPRPSPSSVEGSSALEKIEDFSLEGYNEESKKRWEIKGESADVLEEIVRLNNVTARTYGKEGELSLKSDKGNYDKKGGKVSLENNVVITTSEGTKLMTESMVWDAREQSLSTDDDVLIEKDNLSCFGKGALALPEMKKVEIKKEVKVEIKPKTTITCKGPLELDYDKNISIFYDNVEVKDERGRIFADKIEVYFEPKTKKAERIFAYGNVRIMRDENIAYSDRAIYNSSSGKVTLTGSPRLVLYSGDKDY